MKASTIWEIMIAPPIRTAGTPTTMNRYWLMIEVDRAWLAIPKATEPKP